MIHFHTDKAVSARLLIEQSIQQLYETADLHVQQPLQKVLRFCFTQYYRPDRPQIELLALISLAMGKDGQVIIEGSIFPFSSACVDALRALSGTEMALQEYCRRHLRPWLVMSDPWLLKPIYIAKPWGQEIWYTGIEARGEAEVVAAGGNIPLPWLLELMSGQIGLSTPQPILLKVLDPLADEVYGDLYFELHEKKQEVYVVTHIDQTAWPEGIGAIQLGFSSQVRQLYHSDDTFKQAYLAAVKAYEHIRRAIDFLLDEKKAAAGIELHHPISSCQVKDWINELSQVPETKALIKKEEQLRGAVNGFAAEHPLMVGDVVTVPKLVPHALQHGVRVVEFQTPVYERKILSFGQKVLTQTHWDTEEALTLANMDFTQLQAPEALVNDPQLVVERIVNFDDFEVLRIRLEGDYLLPHETYSILMVVQGAIAINTAAGLRIFTAGEALLAPRCATGLIVSSTQPSVILRASPR